MGRGCDEHGEAANSAVARWGVIVNGSSDVVVELTADWFGIGLCTCCKGPADSRVELCLFCGPRVVPRRRKLDSQRAE